MPREVRRWRAYCVSYRQARQAAGIEDGTTMIYSAYQTQELVLNPLRQAALLAAPRFHTLGAWGLQPLRRFAAACEVFSLARMTHRRPEFGIESVISGKRELGVSEEVVHTT
ncbi:MAG: hypothetical protein AB7E73_13815, partial [Burkholderiales bacterium]